MHTAVAEARGSPFLHPGTLSSPSSLAVLHLRRDQLLPTFLSGDDSDDSDYAEGPVTNTRFGSYPHSTLIGLPWGSQVLASQVDTGSRGRKDPRNAGKRQRPGQGSGRGVTSSKRAKLDDVENESQDKTDESKPGRLADSSTNGHGQADAAADGDSQEVASMGEDDIATVADQMENGELSQRRRKVASAASSGFCHILPPTPECWTVSLPHRTQVVYTPDYSYILQKTRVRPGSIVLEAGAGSGSFTHAAARAVFNGYPSAADGGNASNATAPRKQSFQYGRIYSYEYHAPRASQLRDEISSHGLASLVTVTHRDVYNSGFLLPAQSYTSSGASDSIVQHSPNATHIFLDLPAPWQALPHLTRASSSPLDPSQTAYICIFLPCIEQVQRAVTALRTHGWVEVSMQELAQRRIDVRRDRVGLDLQGLRGVNATPATVDEACARLREVEMHGRRYLNRFATDSGTAAAAAAGDSADEAGAAKPGNRGEKRETKAARLARITREANENKTAFKEGRLVTRTEPEIRTHTSYLVFAVLPREWSPADEEAARRRWPVASAKDKKVKDGE